MDRSGHMIDSHGFHGLKLLDKAEWTSQRPGACADAQCCKISLWAPGASAPSGGPPGLATLRVSFKRQ